MTRDSEDYKKFCAEYEAKEKERKDNPDKYPYSLISNSAFIE